MENMLEPGAMIGILGGGQLGRMLALAGTQLGYRIAIYCPHPNSPAFDCCTQHWQASYEDEQALYNFADACDIISFEFENIPTPSLELLNRHCPIRPGQNSLSTTQDRLFEKDFLSVLNIPVAPYQDVKDASQLHDALRLLGGDIILKTRRLGYDGKGQARIQQAGDVEAAWQSLKADMVIAESRIAFDREISILLARTADGTIATWPASENVHQGGILRATTAPTQISDRVAEQAMDYAQTIADALDYVGVMAVEMFVIDKTEEVIVNEIAPRVHNSGHWTLDGAVTNQFEQHIRAICGLPLGSTDALGTVRMENLIGDEIDRWQVILKDPYARLHHYGKGNPRPGRKMGHVNWLSPPAPLHKS